MYRANKLIDHRTSKTGGREYLVVWHGRNKKGKPWEDSWHKEEDITPDLVEQYEGSRAYGVHSMPVEVDAAMVFFLVRKSLSHALMFGAFKGLGFKGRNRPRVHCLQLPLCQLQAVALGLLDRGGPLVRRAEDQARARQHGPAVGVLAADDQGHPAHRQVLRVRALPRQGARDRQRAPHRHVAALGRHARHRPPLLLTVKRAGYGLVRTTFEFPTVHFNGATGQPTYPHMASGMLKQ